MLGENIILVSSTAFDEDLQFGAMLSKPNPLLLGSPQLPFISNSYYSSDSISPKNQDAVGPKECIKYFSGGTGGPITLYPEPWGTNELEFCEPVTKDFELTKEHKAIFAEEKLPLSMYKFPIGQLISECLFDVFKFSKKTTKNWTNFCPGSKKWSNQQSKCTFSAFL